MKIIKWIPEYLLIEKDKKDQIDNTLLGKYEANSITLLSFFIQKIRNELPKIDKWDNIKNYSNEFKLNEFFDEYFLNNLSPRLLKGVFKFKGTNVDLQYFLKIYNKTFTSKDVGNCNVDFISKIDLDNLVSNNDLFINSNPEQDISTIYKKRLPICANINNFEFYFFLKDYLNYLKKDNFGNYYFDQNSLQEKFNFNFINKPYFDFYNKFFYVNNSRLKFDGKIKFNYSHFSIKDNFNSILEENLKSDFFYCTENFYKNNTSYKFNGKIKFINLFIKENLNIISKKSSQSDFIENDLNNFYKNDNFNSTINNLYFDFYNQFFYKNNTIFKFDGKIKFNHNHFPINENSNIIGYQRNSIKFNEEIKYNKEEEIYGGKNILDFDLNKYYNLNTTNNTTRLLNFNEKPKISQISNLSF